MISGRLPLSFPATEDQTWLTSPAQYPGTEQPGTAEPRFIATYTEELLMGYRWYDAKNITPGFPFGFGQWRRD